MRAHRRHKLLIAISLLVTISCSQDDDSGWYSVVGYGAPVWAEMPSLWGEEFTLVYADPIEDICVVLTFGAEGTGGRASAGVNIKGGDYKAYNAFYGRDSRSCSAHSYGDILASASGHVRVKNYLRDSDGVERPCTVNVDVVVNPHDNYGIKLQRKGIPVRAEWCPRVERTLVLTDVNAAYASSDPDKPYPRFVIAAWDTESEVCVWSVHVRSSDDTEWTEWQNSLAPIEHEECIASGLIHLIDPPLLTVVGSSSTGPITFVTSTPMTDGNSEFDAPCRIDVDFTRPYGGEYYWVPDRVALRDTDIEVVGGCN
jgi:hypothetical protein